MSLIRNTTWSAVAAIFLTGGRFLLTIILAKKLGVTEFGQFAFSQWLVDMVFLSFVFGLPGSATRFFAEFQTQPTNLLAFERWFLRRSFAAVFLIALMSPLVAFLFNGEVDIKLALILFGWSASAAIWALLLARAQGLQKFKRVALSNGAFVVIALAGCVFFPEEGLHVSVAMLLIMAATLVAALVAWLPLPISKSNQVAEVTNLNLRMLNIYGINIWATSLVSALVWSRGELMIVRSELGVNEVAIYSVALSLAGIATQGLMLLTGAIGPHLTQLWGAGKHTEAISLCCRVTDMLTVAAGIIAVFLIAFAPELIQFTFGQVYVEAKFSLVILSIGSIGLTTAAANQLLQIKTNGIFARNANFIGAFFLFTAATLLVKILGIDGAAIARVIAQVIIGIITIYFARQIISANAVNWKNQAKIGFVIIVVVIFNLIEIRSLFTRVIVFILSMMIIVFWLRYDDRSFIFSGFLNRFYKLFLKK